MPRGIYKKTSTHKEKIGVWMSSNRNALKHGMSKTRFYRVWENMRRRCSNPAHKSYKDYGGRGIQVCEQWHNFQSFFDDMYKSYQVHAQEKGEKNTTIERLNVDGNYQKENCSWRTIQEQQKNKRR